jgi:hypothetical protein
LGKPRASNPGATAAAHVVASWRVIHSINSPSLPSSPVTNVQAVHAATISAREDAYTMTSAERDCYRHPQIADYYTTKRLTVQAYKKHPHPEPNTASARHHPTRPTLRGSTGRGKLRARRRSLLQTSSTSRARPLILTRSSLLESPNKPPH